MDRRTLGHAGAGIAEDGRVVERYAGEVVAEVGVRRRDADRLAGVVGQTRGGGVKVRGEDATARPTGVHLLELQEGLVLLCVQSGSHCKNRGEGRDYIIGKVV